jgi:hypothetical protein
VIGGDGTLPVSGPHLLPAADYPLTLAIFRASDRALVWAITVLEPEHGLVRMLQIPPAGSWVGELVSAVAIKPEDWPRAWKTTVS